MDKSSHLHPRPHIRRWTGLVLTFVAETDLEEQKTKRLYQKCVHQSSPPTPQTPPQPQRPGPITCWELRRMVCSLDSIQWESDNNTEGNAAEVKHWEQRAAWVTHSGNSRSTVNIVRPVTKVQLFTPTIFDYCSLIWQFTHENYSMTIDRHVVTLIYFLTTCPLRARVHHFTTSSHHNSPFVDCDF